MESGSYLTHILTPLFVVFRECASCDLAKWGPRRPLRLAARIERDGRGDRVARRKVVADLAAVPSNAGRGIGQAADRVGDGRFGSQPEDPGDVRRRQLAVGRKR